MVAEIRLSLRAGWDTEKVPSQLSYTTISCHKTNNKQGLKWLSENSNPVPSSLKSTQSRSLQLYLTYAVQNRLLSRFTTAHILTATGLVKTKFFGVRLGNIKRKKASNQS